MFLDTIRCGSFWKLFMHSQNANLYPRLIWFILQRFEVLWGLKSCYSIFFCFFDHFPYSFGCLADEVCNSHHMIARYFIQIDVKFLEFSNTSTLVRPNISLHNVRNVCTIPSSLVPLSVLGTKIAFPKTQDLPWLKTLLSLLSFTSKTFVIVA